MNRLGRGLDALIKEGPESTDRSTGITTINVDRIKPNRYQPRKVFEKDKLEDLAQSLKENGMIQPIIVTKTDNSNYELIAGERRLEASKLAGFKEVPVIVRSVSDKQQLQYAIIENIQRENLNPIEEALAYQQLSDEFGLNHNEISDIIGKGRVTITNSLRLLKLNENIRNMIMEGKLTAGHARAILQVQEGLREDFANYIATNQLSVRKAEVEAKIICGEGEFKKQSKKKDKTISDIFKNAESSLYDWYNVDVKISDNNNKGKIVFFYKNEEERENLLRKLKKEDA